MYTIDNIPQSPGDVILEKDLDDFHHLKSKIKLPKDYPSEVYILLGQDFQLEL